MRCYNNNDDETRIHACELLVLYIWRYFSSSSLSLLRPENNTEHTQERKRERNGEEEGGGEGETVTTSFYVEVEEGRRRNEETTKRWKDNGTLQVLSDIRIRLPAQLRLPLQRLGRIEPVHHDLHELDRLARSEGRGLEELVELLLRVDGVRLRAGLEVGGGEDVEKLRPFPVGKWRSQPEVRTIVQ